MKYLTLYITIGVVLLGSPLAAAAQTQQPGLDCSSGQCVYTPLEPIPGGDQTGTDFGALMRTVFRVLFSLAALLAVAMLVAGGIQYMLSEVPGIKVTALARAQAAIYGILILAGSWLILNTINPQLLEFNLDLKSASFNERFSPTTVDPLSFSSTEEEAKKMDALCKSASGGTKSAHAIGKNSDGTTNWECS